MTGRVLRFNETFGFIKADDGSRKDHFVHFTDITNMDGHRSLTPGDLVEFEVRQTERGSRAVNVRRRIDAAEEF